jgi:hypothetical protein
MMPHSVSFSKVVAFKFLSAYLCVPLRLCGKELVTVITAEAQRNAEIRREDSNLCETSVGTVVVM